MHEQINDAIASAESNVSEFAAMLNDMADAVDAFPETTLWTDEQLEHVHRLKQSFRCHAERMAAIIEEYTAIGRAVMESQ